MRFLGKSKIVFIFSIFVFLFFVFPFFSFATTDSESQDGYLIASVSDILTGVVRDVFSPVSNAAQVAGGIRKSFFSLSDSVYFIFSGPVYPTFNNGFNNSVNATPFFSTSNFFARMGDGLDQAGDTYDLILKSAISISRDAYAEVNYLAGDKVIFKLNPPNSFKRAADVNPIKLLSDKLNNKNLISDVSDGLGSMLHLVPVSSKSILASIPAINSHKNELAFSLNFLRDTFNFSKDFFGFSDSSEPSLSPSLEPKPAFTVTPTRVPTTAPISPAKSETVPLSATVSPTSFLDSSFIRNLVKQFFNEEKSALEPLNLISVQGSVSDLNQKLAELTSRVNQIPPPLQYSGGGGGGTTTSVGSNNSEVTGSKLTVGNTTVTSGSIGTTSGNFSIDSSGGTTTISDNLTVTGLFSASTASSHSFTGDLSVSDDIEVTGDASASAIFGAGLNSMTGTTGCVGSTDKLLYTATTGLFSCGTDLNTGGGSSFFLDVGDGSTYHQVSSISFDASHFTTTFTASQSFVKLDWGDGGPASLSEDETITGKWLYSAASVQFNTTIFELAGAASVSVANTNFNINLNGTGDFVVQDAGTAVFTITDSDTITLNDAITDRTLINGLASVTSNFEVTGNASASAFFGAGLNTMTGTTGCVGSTDKLLYTATTGKFSCGTDLNTGGSFNGIEVGVIGGTPVHVGSISFDDSHFNITNTGSESFVRLDWTSAGGPASLSQDETITGKWLFSAASVQFNTTIFELAGAASVSVANTNFNINLNGTGDFVVQDAGTAVFTINESNTISMNNEAGDLVDITGRASISSNLELTGTGWASASFFYTQPGTAALPSFTFGNDTNTGLYRIDADIFGFTTNGTERFRLGTGGASFSYNLEINAANTRAFAITDLGGTQEDILVVDTTSSVSNSGIDITAGEAQTGNLLNFYNSSDALLTHFSATGGLVINIASISAFNIQNGSGTSMLRTDSNTGRTSIGNTALKNFLFVVDSSTGSAASGSFGIRSSNTIGSVASISATSLTTGDVFRITVPPSSSFTGNILLVKDTNNLVLASLGHGGRLALRREIFSHGATSTCASTDPGTTPGCVDLAEEFPATDTDLQSGELVSIDADSETSSAVKRSNTAYDSKLLGIITTTPGIVLGENVYTGASAEGYHPPTGKALVALAGRVPVNISYENGDIKKGDYLTSATVAGKAMKATKKGRVAGMALESADADSGKNQIMVFINPHWAGEELDADGQLADLSGLPPILENNPGLIEAIVDYFKDTVLHVRELVAEIITTQKIKTKEFCIGETCITEEQFKKLMEDANQTVSPSPEPSVSPTPAPTSTQSPTPTSEPSPEPTEDGELIESTPVPSADGGATGQAPEPSVEPTPEPSPSESPSPTPEPTPTPSPEDMEGEAELMPESTPEPMPESTPEPTPEPTP